MQDKNLDRKSSLKKNQKVNPFNALALSVEPWRAIQVN